MIKEIDFKIKEFQNIKQKIAKIDYIGDLKLLETKKVSIVGTRRPSSYTKAFTHKISNELSKRGVTIVSGAAMGVDAIAHQGCKDYKTIAVVANGLNIHYPAVNKKLIANIEQKGLMLSQFEKDEKAKSYTFVLRNELVVALGEILIISEADLNSGSLRSAEFAIKQNKKIFVLPHRINESLGTQKLLADGFATPIYDLDKFFNSFGEIKSDGDDFLEYCKKNPTYEEAIEKYEQKVLEYELNGLITINNGIITTI